MKIFLAVIFSIVLLVCPGCGEGGGGGPICDAMVACGASTAEQCADLFNTVIYTQACEDAIVAASCEDHTSQTPSYLDVCFPPCTGTDSQCNGDQITMCNEGHTYLMVCTGVCEFADKSYVGVCANEYNGQPSSSGDDVCWCQ